MTSTINREACKDCDEQLICFSKSSTNVLVNCGRCIKPYVRYFMSDAQLSIDMAFGDMVKERELPIHCHYAGNSDEHRAKRFARSAGRITEAQKEVSKDAHYRGHSDLMEARDQIKLALAHKLWRYACVECFERIVDTVFMFMYGYRLKGELECLKRA